MKKFSQTNSKHIQKEKKQYLCWFLSPYIEYGKGQLIIEALIKYILKTNTNLSEYLDMIQLILRSQSNVILYGYAEVLLGSTAIGGNQKILRYTKYMQG